MLNYTYETVQLKNSQPGHRVYLGHSRDIAETRAVMCCRRGGFQDNYAVMRVETGHMVAHVNAQALRALAAAGGVL